MMASIETELQPFRVPNYVLVCRETGLKQDSLKLQAGIPLKDIPNKTLIQMCDDFKASVLSKARADRGNE